MVKIFVLIAVSFALFCGYPIAAQSPPAKQKIVESVPKQERATASGSPSETGQHQKNPNNPQHTADKPITPVAETKAPIENDTTKDKYNYEAANLKVQRELSKSTKRIAYFTIALVFVGVIEVIVFLVQVFLLRSTLNATKVAAEAANKSANAAKVSADILPITERAYVFATVFLRGTIDPLHGTGEKETWIDLKNCGRTPAIIKECFVKIGIFQGYPINETLSDCKISLFDPFIDGNTKTPGYVYKFPISEDDINKIMVHHQSLFCFGCIKYITLFGQDHFHGFCWEYDIINQKFVLSDNGELNYNT